MSSKFRKCFLIEEREIDMADLKAGQLFRLECPSGNIDRTRIHVAATDARPLTEDEKKKYSDDPDNVIVESEEIGHYRV